jgi:hypothetical protein
MFKETYGSNCNVYKSQVLNQEKWIFITVSNEKKIVMIHIRLYLSLQIYKVSHNLFHSKSEITQFSFHKPTET